MKANKMIALLIPILESILSSATMRTVHSRGTREAGRELQVVAISEGGGVAVVWSMAGTVFAVGESVEWFGSCMMKVVSLTELRRAYRRLWCYY